jgi:hypothetical protein
VWGTGGGRKGPRPHPWQDLTVLSDKLQPKALSLPYVVFDPFLLQIRRRPLHVAQPQPRLAVVGRVDAGCDEVQRVFDAVFGQLRPRYRPEGRADPLDIFLARRHSGLLEKHSHMNWLRVQFLGNAFFAKGESGHGLRR